MGKARMNKKIMKGAFASGLAVIDGDNDAQSVMAVASNAFWKYDTDISKGLNEVFRMVLAEENTDNIMHELKTVVDGAFDRVSDEILETFEDE